MPHALHFLVLAVTGWVNRHQEDRIDYLREENRVLREHLGPRPLRLTDAQRRRLAVRGQTLGRRLLSQVAGIVTPDTILCWYRRLIAQKYDGSARRRRGRPMTPRTVAELVVRIVSFPNRLTPKRRLLRFKERLCGRFLSEIGAASAGLHG